MYPHRAVSLPSRSCLGLNWVISHSVPVTSCYINLSRGETNNFRLGPNDRPKYISTKVQLEDQWSYWIFLQGTNEGLQEHGDPQRQGSLQSLPHHGWRSHVNCFMERTVGLIFHFQLTARFDFVSLSLHCMHPTYTQTHKHTIKTYKLRQTYRQHMQTHRQQIYKHTKKQTHKHTNTHVLRNMISQTKHIYINTHM